jgi:membrane-associated phospholipid phosphatase
MAFTTLGLNDPEQSPKPVPFITVALVASLSASILFLLLFSWVATEMREGDTKHFDSVVRQWVHGFASPGLTRAMFAISFMGDNGMFAMVILTVVLFLYERWRRGLVWLSITMVGALILNATLKLAFARVRPVPFFGTLPHSYSFPSGHALMSFCFYGVMAGLIMARVRSRWLRIVLWCATALLVLLIGISRIYLGVHYPSDVVAGYLAGAIWVTTMIAVDRLRRTRRGLMLATVADPA